MFYFVPQGGLRGFPLRPRTLMAVSDLLRSWLLIVSIATSVSLVTFLGIGGLVHYWFYVRRRDDAPAWKLQAKRFLSKAKRLRLSWWSEALLVGFSICLID